VSPFSVAGPSLQSDQVRWQDIVLAVGSLLLAVALIPSLRSKDKPALATSLLTASCLAVFAVVYASLELWYSTTTTSLTSLLWFILAYQRLRTVRQASQRG
jgi:hypothetical protein